MDDLHVEQPEAVQYTGREKQIIKDYEKQKKDYEKQIKKLKKTHESEMAVVNKELTNVKKKYDKLKQLVDLKGIRGHRRPTREDAVNEE